MTLRSIDQLREIEPARSWNWDLFFPDAPAPFNEFFPAVDVSADVFNLESFASNVYLNNVRTPLRSGDRNLSITFFDDVDRSLEAFFEEWVQETILNGGEYVATVTDAVKQVYLRYTNPQREIVKQRVLWVYPEGSFQFRGNSESEITNHTLEFVIAGEIPVS